MQLFVLDYDPAEATRMLCDVHLRKMCLETAQILSALLIRRGLLRSPGMPKPFNLNHPVITALNTPFKINWLLRYNENLHREFVFRFGKNHAYRNLCGIYSAKLYCYEKTAEDWSFCRNFKEFTSSEPDIVPAYRAYYRFKKSILKRWHYTRRSEPDWLK